MKKIFFTFLILMAGLAGNAQDTVKDTAHSQPGDTLLLDNIEITAVRASDRAPFTKTNLDKQEIRENNLGQDLPFVLEQTPSVVVNSDAGTGIGYTGISIRGSDATRTNVTINGIPYNDAESQQTYFVDLPDLASSLSSVQVERGVGTSSNGAGAFGATIQLSTNEVNRDRYLTADNTFGSYHTWKNTLQGGTGILHGHFTFDARLSRISSDGYIDRAFSRLRSLYASAAYLTRRSSLRFNIITGKEKTYQAWYGVPEDSLATHRTYNPAGTQRPGSPYPNETDNYLQTHYQLFYDHRVNDRFRFNAAVFLSRGKGYYEEYRAAEPYSAYGLPDYIEGADTLTSTDLIRRLWLDNYFYGGIFSVQYQHQGTQLTAGGSWDRYDGTHYDIVTWASQGFPPDYQYSDVPAHKRDATLYVKLLQPLGGGFSAFADVEGRLVNYEIDGFEDDPTLVIRKRYEFLTPKGGISFNRQHLQVYASWSLGAKEPNRDDFEAGVNEQPRPEYLYDWEAGTSDRFGNFSYSVTGYYMKYRDQLVSTGKINDVGAYTRTNATRSYRLGVELQAAAKFTSWLHASGNISFSRNKIPAFIEYVDDWDNGGQVENHYTNTDISFSPDRVAAASVDILPVRDARIRLLSKYVSRQYLDNTAHLDRSIDPYFVENVRLEYSITRIRHIRGIDLSFQVNNVLDRKYVSNGYTYPYITGGKLVVENDFFPMAPVNFLAAVGLRL